MEPGDPFDAEEAPLFRTPPPPDDRLWRHPSEVGAGLDPGWNVGPARRSAWPVAVASGLIGAVLTVGSLAVAGVLGEREGTRDVVERVAVQPAVAALADGGSAVEDVVRIAGDASPAIVRLQVTGTADGVGSGVVFRDDGHVLTNAHVVDDAREVEAVLADGRSIGARVVGVDAETDVAVVKLDGDGPFPTAVLGTADGLAVGQLAVAIGSPLGLEGSSSVTSGVISALGREVGSEDGPVLVDMIQTDAAIAAGSSGGALLDRHGSVIGITTAFAVSGSGNEGLGFATPVDVAKAVADDLLTVGRVRHVWLGIKGETAPDGAGVTVEELLEGPAGPAGLREGDVIRRIDNRPVMSMSALRITLRRHHPDERVQLVVDRDGERRTISVLLVERPPA